MNKHQPSVAIIVPCFNRWPHVKEAIDSVLNQSWEATQCIVVDDASTDDSFARLAEYYAKESRVSIHRLESNQGQSAARNQGVELCNAEYVGFLDSDDLLVTAAVANRIQLALEIPDFPGIIFSDKIDVIDHTSLLPGKKNYADSLTLDEYIKNFAWLHTNSFLIKKSSFTSLNGFDVKLRKKEDVEFFLRALAVHEARYAGGPCCMVREVDTQRARHDHPRIIEQGEKFIEAIRNNPSLESKLKPCQLKKLLASDTKSSLQSLYRMRKYQEYRRYLITAVKEGRIKPDARMVKRYLLSYFR